MNSQINKIKMNMKNYGILLLKNYSVKKHYKKLKK